MSNGKFDSKNYKYNALDTINIDLTIVELYYSIKSHPQDL